MSMACVFCKIISREAPAEILLETERVIALLTYDPSITGTPDHAQDPLPRPPAVQDEDLHDILHMTQVVARHWWRASASRASTCSPITDGSPVNRSSIFTCMLPAVRRDNIRFVLSLKEYPQAS